MTPAYHSGCGALTFVSLYPARVTALIPPPGDSPIAAYLAAADAAADLLDRPEVTRGWDEPSVLAGMTVGALAAHLARQILLVEPMLEPRSPADSGTADSGAADSGTAGSGTAANGTGAISLLDHYARAPWVEASVNDEPNVGIRESAAAEAADGAAALGGRTRAALARLASRLPGEDADRPVLLPWGPWWLTLADLLRTRILEITVHSDDLACSVGVPTPDLPQEATDLVITMLATVAARRHGPLAVIRALSRAERAPARITAF